MSRSCCVSIALLLSGGLWLFASSELRAEVKAWEGTITIPTYPWEEDINPKFWAMEGSNRLSTTVSGAITYPYTMQDHLSRKKVDRTYRALFLENEYLKITCLPELGGRLHSVLDKTQGVEAFHKNNVIKPSMIAMRGAFISGGVEWNAGPHVHTVTIVSPVDALVGRNDDGSAFLEINNIEKIFRTRWTVRVTLYPGRAYLDEQIRLYNPTDGMHPYYFWNCTAQPNLPTTRFIYPMSLGTDHAGREFFQWPVDKGKDLSWLKNYDRYASIFAVGCDYDFFGSYHVELDRGMVQVANHYQLPGKKAWTWGNWEFGLVSQQNLTDKDGPYIEVQSGPLPTQSDYGMLEPHHQVAWREWWYPVHGLGDGFEYATRDIAVQTSREAANLTLKLIATGRFPAAVCRLAPRDRAASEQQIDLSPDKATVVTCRNAADRPVEVVIRTRDGNVLAEFTTPLPIARVTPPDPARFAEKPDDQLTVEQKYLKGRQLDRATNRPEARRYYELALAADPGHCPSLRGLAVLDLEAGLFEQSGKRLADLLQRDGDDGLAWYFLGICRLGMNDPDQALACGYRAARYAETISLGHDLVGRAKVRLQDLDGALAEFALARKYAPHDTRTRDHWLCAQYALKLASWNGEAIKALDERPTDLVPRALLAQGKAEGLQRFVEKVRDYVGEREFEILETSLTLADMGLLEEAARIIQAALVDAVPEKDRSPMPLYYLAWLAAQRKQDDVAADFLRRAAKTRRDMVFPSRTEEVDVLLYALQKNPSDAGAHLHIGNLYANLGRLPEAVRSWEDASKRDPSLSIAFRNLGLASASKGGDLKKAAEYYGQAIHARPADQTLYRDLAEILISEGKRPEAIELLEKMPLDGNRRSEITIMLAQAYFDEGRFSETIDLLAATPYFVNWEGQDVTWRLFSRAHVRRGEKLLEANQPDKALQEFETAMTYPENLGVGRSDQPHHAMAEYWKGRALAALARTEEARAAWKQGAEGAAAAGEQDEFRKRCEEALNEKH